MQEETPMLSLRERDRRYALVRGLMKEKGLDCLVVAGLLDRAHWDSYFAYESGVGTVIFPLEGEPTYLTWHGSKVGRHVEYYPQRGGTPWIEDWRVGGWGRDWVTVLKEKVGESATIGVVGLSNIGPGALEGYIPYKLWTYVLENLPRSTFVDISRPFVELVCFSPRSAEGLAMLRHSAMIGEKVCQEVLNMMKPGVSENEIYAAIAGTTYRNGAMYVMPNMRIGPENVGAGPPIWIYQGQKQPYLVKKGDVFGAEFFVIYGGAESQQQMAIAVEPVSEVTRKCADVARASFEAGLKMCYAGKTFQDVVDAMEAAVVDGGCWHMGPLIHTMPIGAGTGRLDVGANEWAKRHNVKAVGYDYERRWGFELKPGISLQIEPNACIGDQRINVGCNIVITDGEPEVLNDLPNKMQVVA